jgi:hypothetical protein
MQIFSKFVFSVLQNAKGEPALLAEAAEAKGAHASASAAVIAANTTTSSGTRRRAPPGIDTRGRTRASLALTGGNLTGSIQNRQTTAASSAARVPLPERPGPSMPTSTVPSHARADSSLIAEIVRDLPGVPVEVTDRMDSARAAPRRLCPVVSWER